LIFVQVLESRAQAWTWKEVAHKPQSTHVKYHFSFVNTRIAFLIATWKQEG
jgi:hypothetical protein